MIVDWIQYFNKSLWLAVLLVAAGIMISSVDKKMGMDAREVIVTVLPFDDGEDLVTVEEIEESIIRCFGMKPGGLPLAMIGLSKIECCLEEEAFVRDAEVFVDAQNQLNIRIDQRKPILRIVNAKGRGYYIDKEGSIMPTSPHFTVRVPVATGYINNLEIASSVFEDECLTGLHQLALEIGKDPFLEALISQINVSKSCSYTAMPNVGNHHIKFGNGDEISEKCSKLKRYYKEIIPKEGWRKHKTIDLSFHDQIVCKRT